MKVSQLLCSVITASLTYFPVDVVNGCLIDPTPVPVPPPTSASPTVYPAPNTAPSKASIASSISPRVASEPNLVPSTAYTLTIPSNGLGTCYEPMHSALYPLGNGGDPTRMAEVLETDLKQLSGKFTHIRTYHSQYYGVGIAAFAAKHNLKLYMGLTQFENKEWNEIEIQAALDAVKNFPDTVEAILIGNENLNIGGGDKSVDALIGDIQAFKYRLDQAGLVDKVLVGTTQRVSTMLDKSAELDKLAQNADLLGVNIYPFFTKGWDSSNPVDLLDIQWNQVVERYGDFKNKLRVTETGWPTSGDAPAAFPENLPSVENQKIYFQGLKNWQPKVKTGPAFWFMAYDRRLDDPFMISNPEYERHFGLFTTDNQDKWDL